MTDTPMTPEPETKWITGLDPAPNPDVTIICMPKEDYDRLVEENINLKAALKEANERADDLRAAANAGMERLRAVMDHIGNPRNPIAFTPEELGEAGEKLLTGKLTDFETREKLLRTAWMALDGLGIQSRMREVIWAKEGELKGCAHERERLREENDQLRDGLVRISKFAGSEEAIIARKILDAGNQSPLLCP